MKKETASQIKTDKVSRVLASLGVRTIGGKIVETPERESDNDRRRTENTMQDFYTDNYDRIR